MSEMKKREGTIHDEQQDREKGRKKRLFGQYSTHTRAHARDNDRI